MFNLKGDTVASCDADGIVKLWDVRVVSEFLQIDTGRHPANASNFDRSGKVLAIACLGRSSGEKNELHVDRVAPDDSCLWRVMS